MDAPTPLPSFLPSIVQTKKGLIVFGLQDNFLDTEVHGLQKIVQSFRKFGYVIWVFSESGSNGVATGEEENGDTINAGHTLPECEVLAEGDPSEGDPSEARHPPKVPELVLKEQDLCVRKGSLSAFSSHSFLRILRTRMIHQLYACGYHTDLSIVETARDAAPHGIGLTVVSNCLSSRVREEREKDLKSLVQKFGGEILTSSEVIETLERT